MSSSQTFQLSQFDDPFLVLKNYRQKFIRPKAPYVRKAPIPARKYKKQNFEKQAECLDYKNERKMTADSQIELELHEDPLPPQDSLLNQLDKIEGSQIFLDQSSKLDFILPFEKSLPVEYDDFNPRVQNRQFIDFFEEE